MESTFQDKMVERYNTVFSVLSIKLYRNADVHSKFPYIRTLFKTKGPAWFVQCFADKYHHVSYKHIKFTHIKTKLSIENVF